MVLASLRVGVAAADDLPWIARGEKGIVASDSKYASQAGVEILENGGNAVDAAVGVSFALAVTRPYSTGLGGGGFMVARFADGRVVVQDFRETAPAQSTSDMFVKARASSAGRSTDPGRIGHLAVAVPGLVAGRCQALTRYGTLPLKRVIEPAIRLAQQGFAVDRHHVEATHTIAAIYRREPSLMASCPYVYRTHLDGGEPKTVGEKLIQPALARLLKALAEEGAAVFYEGAVAQAIAGEMARHGGIITLADLSNYKVRYRKPIRATYHDLEILAMPTPSSGGIALVEALNILERLNVREAARRDPALAAHYQIEAMKHAFADRARWLGDSDFVSVPVDRLVSEPYAAGRAARIQANRTLATDDYGTVTLPDDAGTSHFCVADQWGNVVASSETINTSFGSLAAVAEWGLVLNNEMDDFTSAPGRPNAYGLTQSSRNCIEPGKRPLSSMAPTIILREERPYLVLGASGGPRIISSVLNVILDVVDYDMPLERAMQAPRPHHQWLPDQVYFDTPPPVHIATALRARGHTIAERRKTGIVQVILHADSGWMGASDPRKGGRPAGY